jgi:hypothetical protein
LYGYGTVRFEGSGVLDGVYPGTKKLFSRRQLSYRLLQQCAGDALAKVALVERIERNVVPL